MHTHLDQNLGASCSAPGKLNRRRPPALPPCVFWLHWCDDCPLLSFWAPCSSSSKAYHGALCFLLIVTGDMVGASCLWSPWVESKTAEPKHGTRVNGLKSQAASYQELQTRETTTGMLRSFPPLPRKRRWSPKGCG